MNCNERSVVQLNGVKVFTTTLNVLRTLSRFSRVTNGLEELFPGFVNLTSTGPSIKRTSPKRNVDFLRYVLGLGKYLPTSSCKRHNMTHHLFILDSRSPVVIQLEGFDKRYLRTFVLVFFLYRLQDLRSTRL